jgi:hypothetical protein
MAEKQNINVSLLVALGSISTLLFIVVVFGIEAWFFAEQQREIAEKSASSVNWNLKNHMTEQQTKLASYRVVNEKTQIVTMPIERAMELTVQRYRDNSPQGSE